MDFAIKQNPQRCTSKFDRCSCWQLNLVVPCNSCSCRLGSQHHGLLNHPHRWRREILLMEEIRLTSWNLKTFQMVVYRTFSIKRSKRRELLAKNLPNNFFLSRFSSLIILGRNCIQFASRWLQVFFTFSPTWGYDPIWLIFFKRFETYFALNSLSKCQPHFTTEKCQHLLKNPMNKLLGFQLSSRPFFGRNIHWQQGKQNPGDAKRTGHKTLMLQKSGDQTTWG